MEKVENRVEKNVLTKDDDSINMKEVNHFPVVDHHPAGCPNCGSSRNNVTSTRRPTITLVKRFHKCLHCGVSFSSHQELKKVDMDVKEEKDITEPVPKKK